MKKQGPTDSIMSSWNNWNHWNDPLPIPTLSSGKSSVSKMELSMTDISKGQCGRGKEHRFGLTGPNMKENGRTTAPGDLESLHIEMGTAMKENGCTIKPMEPASSSVKMDANTRAGGGEIFSMVRDAKVGKTAVIMKGSSRRASRKGLGNTAGRMEICMKDSGRATSSTARDCSD